MSKDDKTMSLILIVFVALIVGFSVLTYCGATVGISGGSVTVVSVHINGTYPRYDLVLKNGKVLSNVSESLLDP